MNEQCRYLQALFYREIPMSKHMGARVIDVRPDELRMSADLNPNINIHGTAFAGSIYSLCALAAWGLLHLGLRERGLAMEIVMADGNITFHAPVSETIRARSYWAARDDIHRFVNALQTVGTAQLHIPATVSTKDTVAATFTGTYAVATPI